MNYGFSILNSPGDQSLTGGNLTNTRFDDFDAGAWGGDVLRITGPAGGFSITGIAGGYDGRTIQIRNRTGSTITLENTDVNSLPLNQFDFNSSDLLLLTNTNVVLYYDTGDQKWRRLNDA